MRRPSIALAVALVAVAAPAVADPCPWTGAAPGVPIRVPLGAADFGVVPEACAATALSLETRGAITLAEDEFYGSVLAGGSVRIRRAFADGAWLTIWVPGLEYRLVANASLQPTSVDLGAGSLGAHLPLALGDDAQLVPYIRVLVPTETVLRGVVRTGVEIGHSLVVRPSSRLELVGGLALPMVVTTALARAHSSFVPALSLDAALHPWSFLTVAGGLGLRVAAAPDQPVESVDARLALRLSPSPSVSIDLSALLPLAGRDRTDVAGHLSVVWLLEGGSAR